MRAQQTASTQRVHSDWAINLREIIHKLGFYRSICSRWLVVKWSNFLCFGLLWRWIYICLLLSCFSFFCFNFLIFCFFFIICFLYYSIVSSCFVLIALFNFSMFIFFAYCFYLSFSLFTFFVLIFLLLRFINSRSITCRVISKTNLLDMIALQFNVKASMWFLKETLQAQKRIYIAVTAK